MSRGGGGIFVYGFRDRDFWEEGEVYIGGGYEMGRVLRKVVC